MRFDDFEKLLRVYETCSDVSVMPQAHVVARIDGRGFTGLLRRRQKFEAPFDIRVRDMMVATTQHLMNCGFKVIYGYTQSDEISLLFDVNENAFGRKVRKWTSVLAGEASACFTLALGAHAAFDARLSVLPNVVLVADYFRWRQEDAARNALYGHCYWMLRAEGLSEVEATSQLNGAGVSAKNELLFQRGINFDQLPSWQKRGVGLVWENLQKVGLNPKTGEEKTVFRRRLSVNFELPMGQRYAEYVQAIAGA